LIKDSLAVIIFKLVAYLGGGGDQSINEDLDSEFVRHQASLGHDFLDLLTISGALDRK
jgi:hypothetical protein